MERYVLLLGILCTLLIYCDGTRFRRSITSSSMTFVRQPQTLTRTPGSHVNFQCETRPPANYTWWYFNGRRIITRFNPYPRNFHLTGGKGNINESQTILSIDPVETYLYGEYSCVAVTRNGVLSASAWLRQDDDSVDCSLRIDVPLENKLVEKHEYVELECSAQNMDGNTRRKWYRSTGGAAREEITSNSDILVVESGRMLVITDANTTFTGNYTCKVIASNGCSVESTAEVIIYDRLRDVCGTTPVSFSKRLKFILGNDQSSNAQARSVIAEKAPEGSSPWQVSLQNTSGIHICSGVLLTRYYILTAAHCFMPSADADDQVYHQGNVKLVFGDQSVKMWKRKDEYIPSKEEHVQIRNIDQIRFHPEFTTDLDYDLALVRLQLPLKFNDYVRPICLPLWDQLFLENSKPGRYGLATMYGNSTKGLMDAAVPIGKQRCGIQEPEKFRSSMFCTGEYTGFPSGACKGHSGSPLAVPLKRDTDPTRWYLAGILSSGHGCQQDDQQDYNFYANVSMAKGWLLNSVRYIFQ